MQESYENFFHENFAKDQDTLIEHSILQITKIISHENILHEKIF